MKLNISLAFSEFELCWLIPLNEPPSPLIKFSYQFAVAVAKIRNYFV